MIVSDLVRKYTNSWVDKSFSPGSGGGQNRSAQYNKIGNNLLGGVVPEDNHKPSFTNCSLYDPHIPEERGADVYVMTVQAKDVDPIDRGGRITYELITQPGDRVIFQIDNITGNIYTVHNVDRDYPSRDEIFYIIVRATDNGIPPLSDVCTIKITITDVNDNEPWFDKQVSIFFLLPMHLCA